MPSTITTNMSLILPGVGTQPGPQYATDLNNSLSLVDVHDHTSGRGVQIPTAGLNIDAALAMNNFGLTGLQRASLFDNVSPISGGSFPGALYRAGDDLYYNDGSGNQIQLTISGAIAGTPGSIGSLASPAAVTYVSGSQKYLFESNSTNGTPGGIDCGPLILRELTSGPPNGITITPPTSLAAAYTLTLPPALSAGAVGVIDINASGVMEITSTNTAYEIPRVNSGGTALEFALVARESMVSVGQQISSSSGNFTTANTSLTAITNLSVSLTTTGRPIVIKLISDAGTAGQVYVSNGSTGASGEIQFTVGGTSVLISAFQTSAAGSGTTTMITGHPPGSFDTVYPVAAGTYTIAANGRVTSGGGTLGVLNTRLVAYEL